MMEWGLLLDVSMYVFIGLIAGLMAGILGLGGGLVVVPGLLYIFTKDANISSSIAMHLAAGTSLAIMIFTSSSAVKAHLRQDNILWAIYHTFWPGLVIGALFGAIIAGFIPADWLQRLFGVFLLFIAWKLIINMKKEHQPHLHKPWLDRFISVIVGSLSGLLGIGGGTMVIPYLIYRGIPIRKTAPIAGLCSMTVALAGTIAIIIAGIGNKMLPTWSTGYVYWPAVLWVVIPAYLFTPLGVRLTYMLPTKHLKIVFIVLIILTAIAMLL